VQSCEPTFIGSGPALTLASMSAIDRQDNVKKSNRKAGTEKCVPELMDLGEPRPYAAAWAVIRPLRTSG
jgi:hypothetical protein